MQHGKIPENLLEGLKDFPHIVYIIRLLWDYPSDLDLYFKTLFTMDRPKRKGFPLKIFELLIEIQIINETR